MGKQGWRRVVVIVLCVCRSCATHSFYLVGTSAYATNVLRILDIKYVFGASLHLRKPMHIGKQCQSCVYISLYLTFYYTWQNLSLRNHMSHCLTVVQVCSFCC